MATKVAALQARLRSGHFTDGDLDQAMALVKSLRDGTLDPAQLVAPDAAEAAAAVVDEDVTLNPETAAQPITKAVTAPSPEALRQELEGNPDAKRAINAVPALESLVKSFEGIAASLAAMEAARTLDAQRIAKMEGQLAKSLAAGLVVAPAAQAAPATDERSQVGADTANAILKALDAAGLSGLAQKVEQLDEAVNRRPHSGNPSRSQIAAAALAKSMGAGRPAAQGGLTKENCIGLIQKSVQLKRMTETEASEALARLDVVDAAQRQGHTITHADIVRQFDKATLEEYGG